MKGSAKNIGDRTVQKANLVLHFQNDKDEVLGSEIQDVLGGNSLSAGKTRAFSFTVRARENFTDRFLIRVK